MIFTEEWHSELDPSDSPGQEDRAGMLSRPGEVGTGEDDQGGGSRATHNTHISVSALSAPGRSSPGCNQRSGQTRGSVSYTARHTPPRSGWRPGKILQHHLDNPRSRSPPTHMYCMSCSRY